MSVLSVKINQIAALRAIRMRKQPDPAQASVLIELAGADGVTCHLREDRRYLRDRDVYILKEMVKTKLTLQIAPDDELVNLALEVKPYMVMLMPFSSEDYIYTQGIDFSDIDKYAEAAESLQNAGIIIGCFIDPDSDAVKNAARLKADTVELNAGHYVSAGTIDIAESELERLDQAAQLAAKLGMIANSGNGLNYKNIRPLVDLDIIEEFTVGHAIIGKAVMVGIERAVREMVEIIHQPPIDE